MTNELSSPICYGPQADDAYMGYAPRDEILAALTELLEAERAIRGRFSLSRPDAGGQSRRSSPVRDAVPTAQALARHALADDRRSLCKDAGHLQSELARVGNRVVRPH